MFFFIFFKRKNFNRTLTYSIGNQLVSLNIMYLTKPFSSKQSVRLKQFQTHPYERLLTYNATCKYFNTVEWIMISPHLEGFSQIEFFYVKTKQHDALTCTLENECICRKPPSSEFNSEFNKSLLFVCLFIY